MKTRRSFRPRAWAALVTLAFAAIMIHLGNWQASRAEYKITQQRLLDEALAAPPITLREAAAATANVANATPSAASPAPNESHTANDATLAGHPFRYRAVTLNGAFQPNALLFLDNKIQDGKAGYGVLQLFRANAASASSSPSATSVSSVSSGEAKWVLVDRGWIAADLDRSKLPQLDTPAGELTFNGRINLPVSRNPGTADNDGKSPRLNYVNLDEIAARLNLPLERFIVEQTDGAGFLNTPRAAPAANYQKNRAYQMQWYAFAALAVVIFLLLSFRKHRAFE